MKVLMSENYESEILGGCEGYPKITIMCTPIQG